MNSTAYLFGNFDGSYSQYPFDYTSSVLRKIGDETKSTTELCTHRDDKLMYYCYVRKIHDSKYIGACILLNSVMFCDISLLFNTFEEFVSTIVREEKVIKFDAVGNIVPVIEKFADNTPTSEALTLLRERLIVLENSLKELPPVSYSVSKDETKSINVNEVDSESMLRLSYVHSFTCFRKDDNYDTIEMKGSINIINQLNGEVNRLRIELQKANDTIAIQRQRLDAQNQNHFSTQSYRNNNQNVDNDDSVSWSLIILIIIIIILTIGVIITTK